MIVKIFCFMDRSRFEDALNKMLKDHEGENIEIQYQFSAYELGSVYYSAMVIFKWRGEDMESLRATQMIGGWE